MIVFHGSNHRFKTLKIVPKNTKDASKLNEGYGIYFSSDKSVARSYGKYIYVLSIYDDVLMDFRSKSFCQQYLRKMQVYVNKQTGVNLALYVNLMMVSEYMHDAGIAISGVADELSLLLDSSEKFWMLSEKQRNLVLKSCREYEKNELKAYFFPYHIKNIGIIKEVSPDVVLIQDVWRS